MTHARGSFSAFVGNATPTVLVVAARHPYITRRRCSVAFSDGEVSEAK